MKSVRLSLIALALSLLSLAAQTKTTPATNYWSKANPEWPPLPTPPSWDLPMTVYAGGVLFDDTHYAYPSNLVAPKVVAPAPRVSVPLPNPAIKRPDFSQAKQVILNGRSYWINTNLQVDVHSLPALEHGFPGISTNLEAGQLVTNSFAPDSNHVDDFTPALRVPTNINHKSPTYEQDLQKWMEDNGIAKPQSGGGDFTDPIDFYICEFDVNGCVGSGFGHFSTNGMVNDWFFGWESSNLSPYTTSVTNYLSGLATADFSHLAGKNESQLVADINYPDPCSEHSEFIGAEFYYVGALKSGSFFNITNLFTFGNGICVGAFVGSVWNNGDGAMNWFWWGGPGASYRFSQKQPYHDRGPLNNFSQLSLDTGARMNFTFSSTTNLSSWNVETNITTDADGLAAVDVPDNGADFKFFKALFNSNCPPPSP